MAEALDEFRIEGINHNIAFLTAIMHHGRFRDGRLTTGFIAEEYPDGFHGRTMDDADKRRFAAAAVAAKLIRTQRAGHISGRVNGVMPVAERYVVMLDDEKLEVEHPRFEKSRLHATIGGEPFEAAIRWAPGETILHLAEKTGESAIQIERVAGGYRLSQGGNRVLASARSPLAAELAAMMPKKLPPDTSKFLLCPMPGLIVSVNVEKGQEVKAGETLAVVEAMKMENVLLAERDGTVKKINAKKGDSLALDDVILEFA
jgi:propionyl-CoA carboxylase alpha chain